MSARPGSRTHNVVFVSVIKLHELTLFLSQTESSAAQLKHVFLNM